MVRSGSLIVAMVLGVAAKPASAQHAPLAPVRPAMRCESLAGLKLSVAKDAPVRIDAAVPVADAKPHCKVTGSVAPAVRFEVRLPTVWTQRYLQTGCGGLCGTVRINAEKADGCAPVTDGTIVLASTDMGHSAGRMGDERWATDKRARVDFAHRGVHVTALAAKALIKAYYGRAARYSYFSGCSDGGREALMEAQRHPGDFDGIAAGAPALNFTVQNSFYHGWNARVNSDADGRAILNAADLAPLHAAVLAACDGLDGLKDGQIDDPRACRFDPATIQCAGAPQPGQCLTAAQVAVVRQLYDGARDAAGRRLVVGGPQPGSELSWAGVFVPRAPGGPIFSEMIALGTMRWLLFDQPQPDLALKDWRFDASATSPPRCASRRGASRAAMPA